jgi:hypothetical protein
MTLYGRSGAIGSVVRAAFDRFLDALPPRVTATRMQRVKDLLAKHFSWVGPCVKFFSVVGGIAAAVYLVGLLKLGQFTFVQHVVRIWQTPEVTDLRHGIATKLSSTHNQAMRELRVKLATTREPGGHSS